MFEPTLTVWTGDRGRQQRGERVVRRDGRDERGVVGDRRLLAAGGGRLRGVAADSVAAGGDARGEDSDEQQGEPGTDRQR